MQQLNDFMRRLALGLRVQPDELKTAGQAGGRRPPRHYHLDLKINGKIRHQPCPMPGCNFGRPLLNPWLPPAPAPEAKHRQPEPAPEAKHRGRPPVLTPERTADVEEEMRRRAAAGRMSAYVRGEAAYLVTWCKSHGYDISTDTLRHRIADLHRELRQTFDQKSF